MKLLPTIALVLIFDGIDAISETGSEPEVVEFNEVIN